MTDRSVAVFLLTLELGLVAACTSEVPQTQSASLTVGLTSQLPPNSSLEICGTRLAPALAPARCDSVLGEAEPDAAVMCPCFNVDSDGGVVAPTVTGDLTVAGLCPSSLLPVESWRFDYSIWDTASCTGTKLNGPGQDLVCFDARDLQTQAYPNASVENLQPGVNTNRILCITSGTAVKLWHFASCTLLTIPGTTGLRYDCGCEPVAGDCDCADSWIALGDFDTSCSLETSTCNIVCM